MATKLMLCTLQCCRFSPFSYRFFFLFLLLGAFEKARTSVRGIVVFAMEFILVSKRHKECA